nr:3'-5' exonuclease [Bacillus pinisoli]
MILVPEDYDGLNLSPNKKLLISMLRKNLSDDFVLFLEINPTGILNISFVLLHRTLGVLCLTVDEASPPDIDEYLTIVKPMIWEKQEKILFNKLKREKGLVSENNSLKFGFNWIYIFSSINTQESNRYQEFCKKHCIFKDAFFAKFNNENELIQLFKKDDVQNEALNDDEFNNLGFVLAPHYYIPVKVKNIEIENKVKEIIADELRLETQQREVKALSLDAEQINIINQLTTGDQLLLACAGSGKSALLIAKAFKMASVYPDKKILITCFNTNLANYYQWRIDVAGFSYRNVQCRTFHSLLQHLLADNNIKNPYNTSSDSYFSDVFRLVADEFNKGKILPQYDAIFIDEVQIFKKDWFKFCYNMLISKEENEHLFVIAGDKSQNVNENIQKGAAPWQVEDEGFPNFEKNTIRIETNYRNSKQINSYINNFVTIAKENLEKVGYDYSQKEDLFLRGRAKRDGNGPVVIPSSRYDEVKEVFRSIETLNNEHKIPLSEIAILIPQRTYKSMKYFILEWLKDEFNHRYMDYTPLLNDEDDYTRYGERKGVSICTIESALGLDFEAVIICGLFPLGFYHKAYKEEQLLDRSISIEDLEQRKENFFKNINQLYTGMTRARNHLYIVLSNTQSNIYSNILITSQDEEGNNDYS